MKKLYLKSYKNERALNLIKNSNYVLFFSAYNMKNKEKQKLQLELKKISWSFLHCSSKEMKLFNGSIYLICGKNLLSLIPILKKQKNLEKNFLGLLVDKIMYKKDRLNELVSLEKEKKPELVRFFTNIDPKILITKTLLKPFKVPRTNFIKTLENNIKTFLIILDSKAKNN